MRNLIAFRLKPSFMIAMLLMVSFWSCKTTTPEPEPDKYLVAATPISEFTKTELQTRAGNFSALAASFVAYPAKVYKISYKTKNWDGTEVTASGALIIPTSTSELSMISQQHGTIRSDSDAPSNYASTSEAYLSGTLLASVGYIVACPDYIGYGTSKNVAHPYEHRETLAQTSLDMIRACKEFIKKDAAIKWDNRLYITGYSQGGFATMALQKKIEEETGTEFNLRASVCGAGAYNKTATMKALVTQKSGVAVASNNALYAWVLQTYNTVYKINRPMSFYFKEPFASQAQANPLTANINVAFGNALTDAFVKGVTDGTDTAFLTATADNNVFDWAPKVTTRLYHGDADDLVPFLNSQTAFDAMKKKGSTSVSLYPLAGKTHNTAVEQYLFGAFEVFSSVK